MNVVVYAKEDLNALESLIKTHLSLIPNKNIEKPRSNVTPFNENNMKKIAKVASSNEIDELNLLWHHKFLKDTEMEKALNYIWYIVNFGGKNSLFSILKKMDLVIDLNTKISHYFNDFTFFGLKMKLSPLGYSRFEEIINLVFNYIEFIKANGVKKEIFEEAQKLAILNFNYVQKKIDFSYISSIAKKLGEVPDKFILIEEYLWQNFNEKLIKETLNEFKLGNLFIFLNSKNINKTDKFDQYFNTNYSLETINEDIIKKNLGFELSFIEPNPFIPKNTKLLSENQNNDLIEYYNKNPIKIYSSEFSEFFYKIDNKFKIPKSYVRIRISITEYIKNNMIFYLKNL